MTGIYKIVNKINGKMYVGSASNFHDRWIKHTNLLNKNKHHSIKLQRAWNKYGFDNFNFEIIEICELFKDILIEREQHYIDLYDSFNNGYNCLPKAGSKIGFKITSETKEKLRQINLGKKYSDETNKKKGFVGRKNCKHNPTPIIQYDLQGNFIKEWQDLFSLRELGYRASDITAVCRGNRKTCVGYKWKFKI